MSNDPARIVPEGNDAVEKLSREPALERLFSADEVSFRGRPSVKRLLLPGSARDFQETHHSLQILCARRKQELLGNQPLTMKLQSGEPDPLFQF